MACALSLPVPSLPASGSRLSWLSFPPRPPQVSRWLYVCPRWFCFLLSGAGGGGGLRAPLPLLGLGLLNRQVGSRAPHPLLASRTYPLGRCVWPAFVHQELPHAAKMASSADEKPDPVIRLCASVSSGDASRPPGGRIRRDGAGRAWHRARRPQRLHVREPREFVGAGQSFRKVSSLSSEAAGPCSPGGARGRRTRSRPCQRCHGAGRWDVSALGQPGRWRGSRGTGEAVPGL